MKRFLSICCLTVLFMSCGSDDDSGSDSGLTCSEATQNSAIALTNYLASQPTTLESLCNAYKIALQQQKDACGDSDGSIQAVIIGLGECVDPEVVEDNN